MRYRTRYVTQAFCETNKTNDPGWTFNASLHAKRFASMQAARDCLVFAILLTILSSNRLSKEPQISSAEVHKIMINARAGRGFHLAVQLEPCMH